MKSFPYKGNFLPFSFPYKGKFVYFSLRYDLNLVLNKGTKLFCIPLKRKVFAKNIRIVCYPTISPLVEP